jgi:hypothetical protein
MQLLALPTVRFCAVAMAAVLCLWGSPRALAQEEGPASSKGENFSAKPPAALFNSDCTGAGCHKGPQGLGKGQSQGGLSGFLREHYTNSRESAAALAGYLLKLPAGPEPREQREARPTRPGRGEPASASPGFGEGFFGSNAPKRREAKPEPKPEGKPAETRTSRQHPAPASSRAAAKPEDKPDEAAPAATEPKEAGPKEGPPREAPKEAAPKEKETPVRQASPKPPTRAQRGKAAAAAPPPPEPPPAPAAPPPKKEYDIFD